MAPLRLHLLSAFAAIVLGQSGTDYVWSVGAATGATTICNETFADANVSSIYSYSPGVPQVSANYAYAKDIQVGVTVTEATNENVQWSAWLNTNGANYSDDVALGYSMCMFTVQVPTTNTFERGQADSGNCAMTLDSECNSALTDMATSLLLGLVQNPTPAPNSNLTAGSLTRICYEVGQTITSSFPTECNQFFNESAQVAGSPLTTSQTSGYLGGCTLRNPSNATFDHLVTISGEPSDLNYVAFNYFVSPFILSWFPVADIDATSSISTANSVMACPRAKHVNPGSETVSPAPTPTPLGSGGGLSSGAIAGIAIGVVALFLLIVGGAFWFWRRGRKAKRSKLEDDSPPPAYPADAKVQSTPIAEAPAGAQINELSPDNELRPELSGDAFPGEEKAANQYTPELSGDAIPVHEKAASQPPAELLADVPDAKENRR